jgi:DNA-binding transcriptional regulator YbjK
VAAAVLIAGAMMAGRDMMEQVAELKGKIAHCRRLARGLTDDRARQALEDYAEELEKRARDLGASIALDYRPEMLVQRVGG